MTAAGHPVSRAAARWVLPLQAVVLLLAGWWIYAPVLHGDWIWDDPAEISQNAALRDLAGLEQTWSGAAGVDYFPLKTTVQWVEWHLWREQTAGYHCVNLGFHLLGALLLWHLLRQLGIRWACFGSLLFAVHPVAVETVAWISELKNTLSLSLLLLAASAYLDYDDRGAAKLAGRHRAYLLSLGFFLLAMLSKSTVAMFPAVILLHAWWKRGEITRRDLVAGAPFFAISLALGSATIWFQQHRAIAGVGVGTEGVLARLAGAGLAVVFYLSKCIWPMGLLPIYPRWSLAPPSLAQFLPWAGLAAFFGWLWTRRASWGRPAGLGLGWFVLNLVPVLGLVPMSYQRLSWVADHFAYLPLVGLIGLAAAGVGAMQSKICPKKSWPLAVGAGVLCALLAAESHRYAGVFRDESTLWSYTLERNPAAWLAHNNLGKADFLQGRIGEAADQFQRTLELYPDDAEAHFNLGLVWEKEGRPADAMAEDEMALRLRPAFPEAQNSLGNGLLRTGRPTEAAAAYAAALALNPDYAEAHANLGAAFIATERLPQAIVELERALRLRPDYPEAHFNLGNALARTGRPAEAIVQYQQALQSRPDYAEACNSLGVALVSVNRLPESIPQYQRALQLRPNYPEAHFNLGNALAQTGRIAEAILQYEAALRAEPDSPETHNNLGILLAQTGRWAEAEAQFHEALRLKPDYPQARENLARVQASR
jgi:tetratricopeptide (TPR) repeat protein